MLIVPNNWGDLQHYKDRSPPWIKLHKKLLDNFEFQRLPVASRALAPMLWLLASEHESGHINAAPERIAFRLRMSEEDAAAALKPLIDNEFFSLVQPASNALAKVDGGARPETEAEREKEGETKTEGEPGADAPPPPELMTQPPAPTPAPTQAPTPVPPPPPPAPATAKARKTAMPADFGVSERVRVWAAEKGFGQLEQHMEAFQRKAKANGYTYIDWDAAFMEAIREDWAKLRGRAINGAAPPPDVQAPRGPDPALLKIAQDRAKAVKPPQEVLDRLRELKNVSHETRSPA